MEEEKELLLIIIFMQAWYTLNYIYIEMSIGKIRGHNCHESAAILVGTIFERIRSIYARAAIDVSIDV